MILTQEADYRDHNCMQLLPKFGKHDEHKDEYLEKKLREVALAWHEEKQVGSILWREYMSNNILINMEPICTAIKA